MFPCPGQNEPLHKVGCVVLCRPLVAQNLDDFLAAYRAQLDLYALAISKRFAPKPVTYKGIYSLELGKLIEVK